MMVADLVEILNLLLVLLLCEKIKINKKKLMNHENNNNKNNKFNMSK